MNEDTNLEEPPSKLGRTAVKGASVTLLSYVITRTLNLIVVILLARVLQPTGMGVVAAALLAIEIIDILRDFGLREAIIYSRNKDRDFLDTAFTMFLVIGIAQASVVFVLAPFAQNFVLDPVITPVLVWLALLFPINTMGSAQEALLQRSFQFTRIALADVVSVVAKTIIAIGLLYSGAGIWSFVVAMLVSRSIRVILLWSASDWYPSRLAWSKNALRFLFSYGRHIVYTSILFVMRIRAGQLAILLALGDLSLAIYYVAARIPEIAIQGGSAALSRVIFPTLASIGDDRARLSQVYLQTISASMMLMAPVSLGLASVASLLVPALFGGGWVDAVPVLVLLALAGIPTTVGWSAGDTFKATGRPELLSRVTLVETAVAIPLIWAIAYTSRNIVAVAAAMLLSEFLAAGIRLWFMKRHGGVSILKTLRVTLPSLAASSLMAGLVIISSQVLAPVAGQFLTLVLCIGVGVLSYPVILFVLDRKSVVAGLSLLKGHGPT